MTLLAYKVVTEQEECPACLVGAVYMIEGPDGICLGTSWVEDRDEADYWCEELNKAFEAGRDTNG